MVLLAMVNMLLSLVGFLPGLRKKTPSGKRPVDSAANQACIE
jgi:hypothetical protein